MTERKYRPVASDEPVPDQPIAFRINRWADASPEDGIGIMRTLPMTTEMVTGGAAMMAAGVAEGSENRLLFAGAGMSLSYVWFKSGYPLPRHSHDGDCLYHILAGSLRLGSEELGPGDGFFLGGGTPYTYTPGPEGVEVLEFRAAAAFDIRVLAGNAAFWSRATRTVEDHVEAWREEPRPSRLPS
jgi:hypothetical protein